MHIQININIYIHIYIYIHSFIYIYIHIYIHIHLYTLICLYIYMFSYVHICKNKCTYMYAYTHMHMYIYMTTTSPRVRPCRNAKRSMPKKAVSPVCPTAPRIPVGAVIQQRAGGILCTIKPEPAARVGFRRGVRSNVASSTQGKCMEPSTTRSPTANCPSSAGPTFTTRPMPAEVMGSPTLKLDT